MCHGERSFDKAVNVQFPQLALHDWERSGLVSITAFGDHFDPLFLVRLPLFAIWLGAVSLQIDKSAVLSGHAPRPLLAGPTTPWFSRCLDLRRSDRHQTYVVDLNPSRLPY